MVFDVSLLLKKQKNTILTLVIPIMNKGKKLHNFFIFTLLFGASKR